MRSFILALLCLGGFARCAHADVIPDSQKKMQAWTLEAHDTAGRSFSHCTVHASYRGGVTMIFALSAAHRWSIGWSHPSWKLRPGQPVHAQISIDGAAPAALNATARNATLVAAELPADAGLFNTMRQGHQMVLDAPGARLTFSLDGTDAALSELNACVDRYTRPAAAGPSPAPAPPAAAAPPAPAAGASGGGSAGASAGLPLKPGFYVTAGTACGDASFATLWSVGPGGVTIGHQDGRFKRIEKIADRTYRVTLELVDPRDPTPQTATDIYVITSPTSFRAGEGPDADDLRYCPASSLPPPWRH